MKKGFALLFAAMLVFGAAGVLADGTMTDKPISFAEFVFGDTFGSIRKQQKIDYIMFDYYPTSPRVLADVNEYAVSWFSEESEEPRCFTASIMESRNAAGHEAQMELRFAYPESGAPENDAVFYAGAYSFYVWDDRISSVHYDLSEKLKKLYGEPYYEGKKISEALGDFPLSEEQLELYAEEEETCDPTYTVWKSSANGGMLVMKYYSQFEQYFLRLIYADESAEALFAGDSTNDGDSMQGL